MSYDQDAHDSEFDLRARAELALAYQADHPPAHLLRHTPLLLRGSVRRSVGALLFLGICAGIALEFRPPQLVRGAIEHEYYERTLRGIFMETQPLLEQIGLGESKAVPGFRS